jgi:hypothetical protein
MAGDINLTDEALRNAPGKRFLSANVRKRSSLEVPDVCPFWEKRMTIADF